MDAFAIMHEQRAARWIFHLAAATCLIYAALSAAQPDGVQEKLAIMPQLRVTLQTRAAPAPAQPPQPAQSSGAVPPPDALPPVQTAKAATKRIASVREDDPAPAPSVAKTRTPLPDAPEPQFDAVRLARKPPPRDVAKLEPEPAPAPEPAPPVRDMASEKTQAEPVVADVPDTGRARKTQAASVVEEARYRKQTPPEYPRRSLDLGEQGVVTLHVSVLPSGAPEEIKVQDSSGFRRLDLAAMAAVRKWEFEPTPAWAGREITWVRVPVRFIIRNN